MNDYALEIEDLAELADDLLERIAGGSGHTLDPNG